MKALLVGGTGPTGPHLAQGLLDRGYEVTLFHRGMHELPDLPPIEHIHGDPHFRETIEEALRGRAFDLVLATYGRIRHLADVLAGRCARFLAVGGIPAYLGFFEPEKAHPHGLKVLTKETDPLAPEPRDDDSAAARFSYLVGATERHVFGLQAAGAFQATYFRYPLIYGPRQVYPPEWSVVKRVRDRRDYIVVPDGGLAIIGRCAARNAAHCVMLAVDRPEVATGQVYNCADEDQFTLRQWVEIVAELAGGSLQPLSLPDVLAEPARPLFPLGPNSHSLVDITKAKTQLGYRDVQPARAALRETVEWLTLNPVTREAYPTFRDPFDYAAEDQLVAAYRRCTEEIVRAHPFQLPPVAHSYAHPKTPSESADHRGR